MAGMAQRIGDWERMRAWRESFGGAAGTGLAPGMFAAERLFEEPRDVLDFGATGDGVFLLEFLPEQIKTRRPQSLGLGPDVFDAEKGIEQAVGHEHGRGAGVCGGGGDEMIGTMDPSADADDAGEAFAVSEAGFEDHEAALGKTEERDVLRRTTGGVLGRQDLFDGKTGPFDRLFIDRREFAGEPAVGWKTDAEPAATGEIIVGSVEEQDVEPWELEFAGKPFPAFGGISQSMEDDEKGIGPGKTGRDARGTQHAARMPGGMREWNPAFAGKGEGGKRRW